MRARCGHGIELTEPCEECQQEMEALNDQATDEDWWDETPFIADEVNEEGQ